MPIVTVMGAPNHLSKEEIDDLDIKLSNAVVAIEELNLTNDEVTIFFPQNRRRSDSAEEIIIFVDGLFVKPERTAEVKNRLAMNLAQATKTFLPSAYLIECFVRSFDPESGFHVI